MKKTLLLAAAALVAGLIASPAQQVSQNIVGYVSKPLPADNAYSQIAAPFLGNTNTVEALMPSIRKGDNISLWTGHSYRVFTYAGPNFDGQGHAWVDSQGNAKTSPVVYPGQSFFYQNNGRAPITNVFYGSVALTNSTTIPGGHAFTQLASTIPVVSPLDGTNLSLPFQPGDCVTIFTGARCDAFTYRGANFDGLGHAFTGADGLAQPSPIIQCGQGFIYQNNQTSAEIWNQQLKIQ